MSDEPVCGERDGDGFSLTPQQQAALELDYNIAITAGAGTGKTTTLTERYRSILTSDEESSPKDILTLTFTTDATGEMQEQIRDVVDEELTEADRTDYQRWRGVKDDLEDAYIHTIHGFCSRILREFAVEAGVHPDFETLDEGESDSVINETITTVLDWYSIRDSARTNTREPLGATEAVRPEWDLRRSVQTLTRVYSRRDLESALSGLFDEQPDSIEWATHAADRTPESYQSWLTEHLQIPLSQDEADELMETETAQAAIDDILGLHALDIEINPNHDTGAALLNRLATILTQTKPHHPNGNAIDRQWFLLTVADAVTTEAGSWTSQAWRYAGSAGRWSTHGYSDEQDTFRAAVDAIGELVDAEGRDLGYNPGIVRNEAEQAIALARLFLCVCAEYDRRKRQRNALDYADLIKRATEFLATDDTARRTLRDQFEYIMVDEVQDTDPRQWQLIKLLSGDDPDGFDGQNVFLVGDEKQSIYRFREADVTQFSDARNRLLADNPTAIEGSGDGELELSGNFRTLEGPLSLINELFERVLQPAARDPTGEGGPEDCTNGYEPYEAIPQSLTACRNDGTDIDGTVEYLVVPEDEDADAAFGLTETWFTEEPFVSTAEREATAVADRLTQLFDSTRIYDRDTETYTTARPQDVALLFRSSRRLAAFERAFEKKGIPYTNLASGSFYDTPEIKPLCNLFRVLEDPTADIPLYGVLRSPLFGFEDGTIAQARKPDIPLWDGLADAAPALQTARDKLEAWRDLAGLGEAADVHHWSTLLSEIIDETGYLIGVGADERSQQAVANVEQFRARIRSWEEGSANSIASLLHRIQRERESDSDPSEATIPGDIEGVQLRTIHSSKGLEFPIVIIPELTREFNFQSSLPKAHLETLDGSPIVGMKAPDTAGDHSLTSTSTYLAVREAYRQRERAEKRRLLYVAATRARDHLILSGTHSVDAETESGLKSARDWAEAKRWQDWVQPILLNEPGLVETLTGETTVTRTLDESTYVIRHPEPPTDWISASDEDELPSDIEIPEPPHHPARTRISATEFRDRLEAAPTRPEVLRASPNESAGGRPSIDDTAAIDALDDATVGTIVHRLCELQLPKSEWPIVIRRHVDDPEVIDPSVIDAITAHAEAGLDGLQNAEAGHPIHSRHFELSVTLELDTLHVRGDIDHLSVTDDGYLLVDYKTSDLSGQDIATLIEHYLPQLVAYAGALCRSDVNASEFEIVLVFTDTGTTCSRTVTRDDVKALLEWAQRVLG